MERNLLFQTLFNILNLFVIGWLIFTVQFNDSKKEKFYGAELVNVPNKRLQRQASGYEATTNKSTINVNKDDILITVDSSARTKEYDFVAEMDKLNEEKVEADDPRLVRLIRNHYVIPPSDLSYNLFNTDKRDTSMGQAAFVDNRLGFKEGGFFIESGAHDGEYLSNTLFLERYRHWTGVLIEPLPAIFEKLLRKRRKCYSINACLSIHPYPSKETMTITPVVGGIVRNSTRPTGGRNKTVQVQCFPLYSIFLAFNRTFVDFLSLDVEGVEYSVLNTVPWRKVNITMLSIEYDKWPGGPKNLCVYMTRRGYECAMTIRADGAADVLFKKKN